MKLLVSSCLMFVLLSFNFLPKEVLNVEDVENGYFKTYKDYEEGNITPVEKIDWKVSYVAAGCKFKMKKEGEDILIRGDEMWGFKRGGVLFRCMPIYDGTKIDYSNRGLPLKVVKEGKFVYYEGGNFWWDYHGGKKDINAETEQKFFKYYRSTNGSGYYKDADGRVKLGSASFVSTDLNSRVFPLSRYITPIILGKGGGGFKQQFQKPKAGYEIEEDGKDEFEELISCVRKAHEKVDKKDKAEDRLKRLKQCALSQIN